MSGQEIRGDKVAIYIRWSTEDQGEGTTLAVQMEACRHYVVSQGWQVREELIFIDDGYSGGSLDRPALTRLRKRVTAGDVDCVVVFKIDRLSRSVIDTVSLVLKEWEELTHLKSAREPVDTTSAMGKQFFYMLVSYAEWERNVIRERMFSGKLRRAKDGRSPGFPAPYGYRTGPAPGALLVQEDEARIVRLIFDLAEQGHAVRAIARQLGARACRARKGAPFATSTISKLLHNPAYAGRLVWGRYRINPRWKKAPGEARVKAAEPYVALPSANIPALVSPAQFDRVQRLLAANRQIEPGARGSEHLLTGLLRCGRCGRAMQYNAYGRWAYYRCARRQGQGLCDAPAVRAAPLEQAVAAALRARYEARAAAGARTLAAQPAATDDDAAVAAAQLARLAAQERRIDQDYRAERLTADERRRLLAAVAADRAELEQVLARLRAAAAQAPAEINVGGDLFALLTPAEQKQLLRYFIAQVRVADGVATLTWKAPAEPVCPTTA